jgi:HemN C-terminal region.
MRGFDDHDLFGFGVNAISATRRYRIQNTSSLRTYITAAKEGRRDATVSQPEPALDAARPIALKLSYAGFIARDRVN